MQRSASLRLQVVRAAAATAANTATTIINNNETNQKRKVILFPLQKRARGAPAKNRKMGKCVQWSRIEICKRGERDANELDPARSDRRDAKSGTLAPFAMLSEMKVQETLEAKYLERADELEDSCELASSRHAEQTSKRESVLTAMIPACSISAVSRGLRR